MTGGRTSLKRAEWTVDSGAVRSRHLGLVLFARYVAISLVPVLLLGTAVDLYTRHQVRAQKVAAATKQSEAVVTAAFTPFADQLGGATGAPNPLLALPLQQVTEQAQRSGLLRGLRLWNPDGHLVWAGGELVDHPASVTERAFYDAAAGTIRGDFAIETGRNLVHASDEEPGSAEREVNLWFGGEGEILSWSRETDRWIYE